MERWCVSVTEMYPLLKCILYYNVSITEVHGMLDA